MVTITCAPTVRVRKGYLLIVLGQARKKAVQIVGVTPDTVSKAAVERDDGQRRSLRIKRQAYAYKGSATAITLRFESGRLRRFPTPSPQF